MTLASLLVNVALMAVGWYLHHLGVGAPSKLSPPKPSSAADQLRQLVDAELKAAIEKAQQEVIDRFANKGA